MKSLRFIVPLAIFLVLAGFLAVGLNRDPRMVPSPLIGKPAPGFKLPRLDEPSKMVNRDEMLGKAWVLNVWASWCGPCREEHPHIVAFARTKQVPLVGLNYKDARSDALAWLKEFGNPYDLSLSDLDGRVGIDFGVYGVPETFVIDKRGVIRFKQIGPLTPEVLNTKVVPLLKELNG
ncbi:MAG TPA: DsbE family thiol:disulfide interchange protein [Burkholderiaceae bacterium]|nr:DsbE family thiol:disulfide interchange protein [Burkholderiaceae bacterium]HSC00686.1 DsbE family thiol:disulfide interchange protein [Burkholderiaceae bacterium]